MAWQQGQLPGLCCFYWLLFCLPVLFLNGHSFRLFFRKLLGSNGLTTAQLLVTMADWWLFGDFLTALAICVELFQATSVQLAEMGVVRRALNESAMRTT